MKKEKEVVMGVLGGSGVYKMPESKVIQEHEVDTPFGKPSDKVIETELRNRSIFFLPRHGRGHHLLPSEIPAKANIYALKALGVTHLLAISACGIMRKNINPGDMIVPDQIFDRTKSTRPSTFFGAGIVGHIPFADPFCHDLRSHILEVTRLQNLNTFDGGTYLCMEGPQFSTRAESNFYRKTINASVIGMTALPEAKLAREAELCYAMLAMGTDYDCWHEEADDVNIETVLKVMKENTKTAHKIISQLAKLLPKRAHCLCQESAQNAILTDPKMIPEKTRETLNLFYGKYLN
ncbi:MAG: S-methyl-5'-thioadenosine phosphorylase [Candidatus Latescibacterota bacterium]|nr:S-methyl-5'-thioadenosine phosphorylase [Candidatus Latescibacterota bacterium]